MDDAAFESWYRRQHPGLVATLVVVAGGDVAVAAEAADEAFARAYAQWDRVGRMTSPGGWAYRTAFNVVRRRYRRARLESVLLRSHRAGVEGAVSRLGVDWSAEVWDALRRLPRRERTAVALRYVVDLPIDRIAEIMGIAPGTVGSTLHAAKKRLAVSLREDPESSPVALTPTEEDSNA